MLDVRIARKCTEAERIASFELVAADGQALPPFTAGAHIDVHLPSGLVRSYSLCNPPTERHRYLIAVQRELTSRGGSTAMHELAEAHTLRITEPRNHFEMAAGKAPVLLVAGGIGITPLLAMAEHCVAKRLPFALHVCSGSAARVPFQQRLAHDALAGKVHLHLDDGPAGQRFDARAVLNACAPGTHLYVCGPNGFMAHVLDTARTLGWPEDRLHREHFGSDTATTPQSGDNAFELVLQRSGRTIPVGAGQTALRALQDAGVSVLSSCEQGVCGTCVTPVIDGEPDHRDLYLTDEERARNDCFTPCCSRARTARLVLDL